MAAKAAAYLLRQVSWVRQFHRMRTAELQTRTIAVAIWRQTKVDGMLVQFQCTGSAHSVVHSHVPANNESWRYSSFEGSWWAGELSRLPHEIDIWKGVWRKFVLAGFNQKGMTEIETKSVIVSVGENDMDRALIPGISFEVGECDA